MRADVDVDRELLERLWREPRARSRNANFARYRDDRDYRRAVEHVRTLIAFRQELERFRGHAEVVVRLHATGNSATVSMRLPSLRARRSIVVSRAELDLLRREPTWDDAGVVFVDLGDPISDRDRKW